MQALPIDKIIPDILDHLSKGSNLILEASPGSGKTTRVPPALLTASFLDPHKEIYVLEPRRLAAKYAATRIADELQIEVGKTVGYQFRFENKTSFQTRLRFLTEGMLMRILLQDPQLKKISAVILDEFHERHLHTDISLSYLRLLQCTTRSDLKIIVMSATLDSERLSVFLGNAPVIKLKSQLFPVECQFIDVSKKYLDEQVSNALQSHLTTNPADRGDILIFLPGKSEIRRCEATLSRIAEKHQLIILPLHGDLSREAQDLAIQKLSRRKVILSTNVAETSLTIEGITCVIDSGLHRIASYSWWTGVPQLALKPISKASAIQRMGRAGRTQAGKCIRLYSKHHFDTRAAFETPEISRADLTQSLLELKSLEISDTGDFRWFEPPPKGALEAAESLLVQLGATLTVGNQNTLTPLGRRMSQIAIHPRISRFLFECEKAEVLDAGLHLAALLAEGKTEELDFISQTSQHLDQNASRLKQQLASYFNTPSSSKQGLNENGRSKIAFALLTAFPDRLAKKRILNSELARHKEGEVELLLSAGGSLSTPSSELIAKHDYFIALDVQERKSLQGKNKLSLESLVPIEESWLLELQPSPLQEIEVISWDKNRRRVSCVSELKIGQIVLDQKERIASNNDAVFPLLVREVFKSDPHKLPGYSLNDWIALFQNVFDKSKVDNLMGRMSLLSQHQKEVLPPSPETLSNFFKPWLSSRYTLDEIENGDFFQALLEALSPEKSISLEQYLPDSISLSNGRKLTVQYSCGKNPWAESRLQDFFGLKDGPKLLNGRLPLTLHLLAPNYRAVQVTSDLKGFWERSYPAIRSELGRKYPRHSWPDDPQNAKPPEPKAKRRH